MNKNFNEYLKKVISASEIISKDFKEINFKTNVFKTQMIIFTEKLTDISNSKYISDFEEKAIESCVKSLQLSLRHILADNDIDSTNTIICNNKKLNDLIMYAVRLKCRV